MSGQFEDEVNAEVETLDPQLQEPRQFEVLLLNDDYTTMEFVTDLLKRFFCKSANQAERIMLEVHERSSAVVAIYPKEIAESKVDQVTNYARENDFPLMCTMRPH